MQPHVATRERYLSLADQQSPQVVVGWRMFATKDEGHVDGERVGRNVETIEETTDAARNYVNKRLAHRESDTITGPITLAYDDLNSGLDRLGQLLQKYWPLFHPAAHLWRVTPDLPLGWVEMFATPWLSPGYEPIKSDDLG